MTVSRREALAFMAASGLLAGCRETAAPPPVDPGDPRPPEVFRPRTAAERASAVGPVRGLPAPLRRAFDEGEGFFESMGEPRDGDWLDEHEEGGQTFQQWRESEPNLVSARRDVIDLHPVGDWPARAPSLATLKTFTRAFFGIEVNVQRPTPVATIGATTRQRRTGTQMLTTDVLNWLERKLSDRTYCALAVTMVDLYPDPAWNFVFGQAALYKRVGVFSFARHDPNFHRRAKGETPRQHVLERSMATVAHEICHMFGMGHCVYYSCLVSGSNSGEESDRRPLHLCPVCLRKLSVGAGFDVVKRYRRLEAFHRTHGSRGEADWIARRLKYIVG